MVRQERIAWLSLSVISLALVTFGALSFVIGPGRAIGAFGLLGLLGLIPAFYPPGKRAPAQFDERDNAIQAKSVLVAYSVFWLVFVSAGMTLYLAYQERGAVPVQVMPLFPFVGWMVVTLVQSVATLIQYARGR
jgi:hypothetical protein